MWKNIVYVSLGAVAGGIARYLIKNFSSELSRHHGFPYGTLAVNLIGCIVVGYVLTGTHGHAHDRWRLLLATGFCGAFTTFSEFAYESMAYFHQGRMAACLLNIAANNGLCMLGITLGIRLHRAN